MIRIAKTEAGMVQGYPSGDPRITVYKGIPYAKPPVGELRWRVAQPMDPWDGIYKADHFADIPMMYVQPGTEEGDFYNKELNPTADELPMSEDCLYLNIWTPAESPDEKLPVLFYIHGGGFTAGYSYEMEFDGERVARKGVIMVTVGYRLNVFGFFAHPELSAEDPDAPKGNYGVTDQMTALKWVKRNIGAFGGDPDQIVIAGQSAGAASVQCQLVSPMTRGLFQGAIIQSAVSPVFADAPAPRTVSLAQAEEKGECLLKEIGLKSIEEARACSAKELIEKIKNVYPKGLRASPVTDGIYLTEDPGDAYLNNHYPNIPIMFGHNYGEAVKNAFRMGPALPENVSEYETYVQSLGEDGEQFRQIAPVSTDEEVKKLFTSLEYNRMFAGTRMFGALASEQGRTVYSYLFDAPIPGEDDPGSFHGAEMWFSFDSLNRCWRPFEGYHYDLARQINGYWVNFVKNCDPNGCDWHGKKLPEWKPYDLKHGYIMKFEKEPVLTENESSELMKFRIEYTKKKHSGK